MLALAFFVGFVVSLTENERIAICEIGTVLGSREMRFACAQNNSRIDDEELCKAFARTNPNGMSLSCDNSMHIRNMTLPVLSTSVPIGLLTHLTSLRIGCTFQSYPTLTKEFATLTSLTALEFSYAGDGGSRMVVNLLPYEWENLLSLEYLDLFIAWPCVFTIPSYFGRMRKLVFLRLGSAMNGTIPTEIGQLTLLTYLHLANMPPSYRHYGLTGTIPSQLAGLTSLKYVSLAGNFSPSCWNLTYRPSDYYNDLACDLSPDLRSCPNCSAPFGCNPNTQACPRTRVPALPPTLNPTATLSPTPTNQRCIPSFFQNANCEFDIFSLAVIVPLIVVSLAFLCSLCVIAYMVRSRRYSNADYQPLQNALTMESIGDSDEEDSQLPLMEMVSSDNELALVIKASMLDTHEAVEEALGMILWESDAYLKMRDAIKKCVKSSAVAKLLHDHPGLTLDAVLSLAYYSSDIRKYGGLKSDNVYWRLNQAMCSRNDEELAQWNPFLFHLYEAKKYLPKFQGTVYRGIDKPLSELWHGYQESNHVTWISFSSATTDKNVIKSFSAKNKGTWMIIKDVREGLKMPLSLFPGESEVLLYPNTIVVVEHVLTRHMKQLTHHPENLDIIELTVV